MLIGTLIVSTHACAQPDLYALEAAYVFNFAEFTQWPADGARSGGLRVCARAQSPLRDALAALDGRSIGTSTWRFKPVVDKFDASECDVLILDAQTGSRFGLDPVINTDRAILIVGADDAVASDGSGAVIQIVHADEHLQFEINNTEAARRHLVLSSKLLRLARKVR
ncbi:DUF4154 domain-containing protein [Pararobbsia alpina]